MDASATSIEQLLRTAVASHRAGKFAEARQSYERILKLDPQHAEAAFSLGLLEFASSRHDAALKRISRAVEASPGTMRYQIGLGQVLTALKRNEEAAQVYETVLAAEPGLADVQFALGLVRETSGDWDRAALAYGVSHQNTSRFCRCAEQSRQLLCSAQAANPGARGLPPGAGASSE